MGVHPVTSLNPQTLHDAAPRASTTAGGSAGITVPGWVHTAVTNGVAIAHETADGLEICIRTDPARSLALTTCRLAEADRLEPDEFRMAVSSLYLAAGRLIAASPLPHLVRVWQFIPDIHREIKDGIDRYMVFNQGRYEAFCTWFGGVTAFPSTLPAATAVGHDGPDLFVHFLTSNTPGRSVENPRQRPAFEYSRKYGPRPPCFARGTVAPMNGFDRLCIAGTASIRGEATVFPGMLEQQLDETLDNLAAVVQAAARPRTINRAAALERIDTARAYVVDPANAPATLARLRAALPGVMDLEVVRATICRTDLLLEVEATAAIGEPGDREVAR